MTAETINLRAERFNRGLSLADAAKQMEVALSVLENAEAGRTKPHPGNAYKIATFYGYKVTDVWPLDEPTSGAAA